MKLFHREIFWPQGKLNRWQGKNLKLQFSGHAKRQSIEDRYGYIFPPREIVFDEARAFEIELNENKFVNKVAVRVPYDKDFDLTLVICFDGDNEAFVKTLWKNSVRDGHATLNHSLYSKSI